VLASQDRSVTRSVVVHAGIEYAGECVRMPWWDNSFGEELRGDTYFRVVFLEGWPPSPPEPCALQGQRIAVCVLGKEPGRSVEQLLQELRTVREAYAQHLAGPSVAEIEGHPLCPMCGVRLPTQPPTKEVESLGSTARR